MGKQIIYNKNGIEIKYNHENWAISTNYRRGTQFVLFSRKDLHSNTFRTNINYTFTDLPYLGMSLNLYIEHSIANLHKIFKNVRLKETSIESLNQAVLLYTFSDSLAFCCYQKFYLDGNKVHLFTFTGLQKDFPSYLNEVRSIMDSVKIYERS
jgi:hypothetical protein